MSEQTQRKNLVKKLAPLDAVAIESHLTGKGIPDVNYIGGWIECKWLKRWPKEGNFVRFGHELTQEQKVWRTRRIMRGGTSLVCCQISRSWLFYQGLDINNWFGNWTQQEMIVNADYYDGSGLDSDRLIQWLRGLTCRETQSHP